MQRLRDASKQNTFMAVLVPIFTAVTVIIALFLFVILAALLSFAAEHYLWVKIVLSILIFGPIVSGLLWALGTRILEP